tara:strand:+ start:853 stop:1155 length:303 start_codon:yes stop_codon:yes gene_type:complete
MPNFNILNAANGNVINTIVADAEFVEANFEHYELYVAPTPVEPTAAEAGRTWRNGELSSSDYIVQLSDHPQRAAYMAYRESLRTWPSTAAFPDTRPVLGS